jgi:hypothetical protein
MQRVDVDGIDFVMVERAAWIKALSGKVESGFPSESASEKS